MSQPQTHAPGSHPDLPPPGLTLGPLAWLKENLFGSATSAVLTCLSLYFIWITVPPLLEWAWFDASLTGESRRDCRARAPGACWAFIHSRFQLFV